MELSYANLKKLSDKKGEIEYQAEIPNDVVERFVSAELARAGRDFELPGFRKGKVPEHLIREHVDPMRVLENAADEALRGAVREIISAESLGIIGSPRLTITKLAPGNPIEFKVMFARYPEITLPDYRSIGKGIAERQDAVPEITEAELNKAIDRLLTFAAGPMEKTPESTESKSVPQLTDELVARFGPFKTVDEFKAKLKENLASDKVREAKDAKREEVMHAIVAKSKVELPQMFLDEEWYAFEERRNAELEEAGISLADYLKQIGKSEADLEKEERALIAERIKTSIVFREIQKTEHIEPGERDIQTSIAYLKLQYRDRSEAWLRETAEGLIVQDKIFALLELPIENEAA